MYQRTHTNVLYSIRYEENLKSNLVCITQKSLCKSPREKKFILFNDDTDIFKKSTCDPLSYVVRE